MIPESGVAHILQTAAPALLPAPHFGQLIIYALRFAPPLYGKEVLMETFLSKASACWWSIRRAGKNPDPPPEQSNQVPDPLP
jgi:hypothetical protein